MKELIRYLKEYQKASTEVMRLEIQKKQMTLQLDEAISELSKAQLTKNKVGDRLLTRTTIAQIEIPKVTRILTKEVKDK